jgi:hypothetical protein
LNQLRIIHYSDFCNDYSHLNTRHWHLGNVLDITVATLAPLSTFRSVHQYTAMSEDEFGSDIEFTQELEDVLQAAETQPPAGPVSVSMIDIEEIEDLVRLSPMEEFRKKGYLSVSDLVGTVWCEVQVSGIVFK